MAKYKCTVCGDIYDEDVEGIKFKDLPDSWVCPLCGVPKYFFEEVSEDEKEVVTSNLEEDKVELINAIQISEDNPAIERDESICIDCGMCKSICKKREGIEDINKGLACVNCGQCVQMCPVRSLMPKNELEKFKQAKKDGKICIAYTSPAVRVAIGECFGMEAGTFAQGKLVAALRKLGFDYVFDVTFGADLTIMEEANELIERVKENKKLPMFTSCCPAWVKYAEINYPEILDNLSSCKSPIGMQGAIVRNYFLEKYNLDDKNTYTVAITPCTAKKYEVAREEIDYTDLVLTTREIVELIKSENINFKELKDENYDNVLGEGSGAGMIFGNTGGVMEAALRTAYNILTGDELPEKKIEFSYVRGMDNVREADIDINGKILKVAVINQMSSAIPILEEVKQGKSKYHFIEIMNCLGGCVGGGGQPHVDPLDEIKFKQKRIESLYLKDKNSKIRFCHKNPDIIKIYNEFLDKPLSKKSEELLHTKYKDKSELRKKGNIN